MDKNALLIDLSESDRTMFGRVDFDQQPPEQQVFSAIWALESQVNNGEFAQFLQRGRWRLSQLSAARLEDDRRQRMCGHR